MSRMNFSTSFFLLSCYRNSDLNVMKVQDLPKNVAPNANSQPNSNGHFIQPRSP